MQGRASGPAVQEVGDSLLRLGRRIYRLQVETLESLSVPLSVRQFRILDRVGQGVSTVGEHATLARRRPSTISKSVDSMVRQGLLTREEDKADRRAINLGLTGAGDALLGEARGAVRELAAWLVEESGVDPSYLLELSDGLYERTEARFHRPPRAPATAVS